MARAEICRSVRDRALVIGQCVRVLGTRRSWVILLLGSLVVAGCSNGDKDADENVLPSAVPSDLVGDATRFVFDEAPDAGSFTLLGSPGDEPFGKTDAAVELVWRPDSTEIDDNATVRDGRPADVQQVSVPGGQSASVTWMEDGDTLVTARSRTLDASQLVDVVEALAIDGHEVHVDNDPFGLGVVGVVPLPIYDSGYSVTYGHDDRYLNVDVHPTSGDEMLLYSWGPTELATVDGREVLRLLADQGAVPGYVFEYRPGLVVKVDGSVTDDELRAAAGSLAPVSDDALASIATQP